MLSLEQEFKIAEFKLIVNSISLEQAKELLLYLYILDIEKSNSFRELVEHNWFTPQ